MAQTPGQRKATDAVAAELVERGWSKVDFAEASGLDYGTVSDLLDYSRAIQSRTQHKVEDTLGWSPGTYRRIALGAIEEPERIDESESVGAVTEDDDTLLYRRPAGITDEKWRQLRARTRNLVEWEIEQALKEARGEA